MQTPLNSFLLVIALSLASTTYARTANISTISGQPYEAELKTLNTFLEEFEAGYYGYIEADDQFITIRFQEGKYSKFRLQDMAAPVLDTKWGQVNWDCKNESYCVQTDWNETGKETGILFSQAGSGDLEYLVELLQNFISAYTGK